MPKQKVPAQKASSEKLQKVLAEAGVGSRREMERWIEGGRVQVNDEPAHLGQRITGSDRVQVDGKPLRRHAPAIGRVLLYNKPVGEVCTRKDPEGRRTVFEKLPELQKGRWVSIGRLDIATSGLLLMTDDGALANRMMHPSTGLDREYVVRVNGLLDDEQLAMLTTGIEDDGERLALSDIQHYDGRGTNHFYHVVLTEGKNREIRRLFEHFGFAISRLKRVRYGPVVLPARLTRGRHEMLSEQDVVALYSILKLPHLEPRPAKLRHGKKGARESRRASVLIPYPELTHLGG